ncbi:hypothetical protein MTO96_009379 [Rhipicephalus appendiculatus]
MMGGEIGRDLDLDGGRDWGLGLLGGIEAGRDFRLGGHRRGRRARRRRSAYLLKHNAGTLREDAQNLRSTREPLRLAHRHVGLFQGDAQADLALLFVLFGRRRRGRRRRLLLHDLVDGLARRLIPAGRSPFDDRWLFFGRCRHEDDRLRVRRRTTHGGVENISLASEAMSPGIFRD